MAFGALVALWVLVLVLMWVVGNVGSKEVLCWSGCTLLAQVLGGDQGGGRGPRRAWPRLHAVVQSQDCRRAVPGLWPGLRWAGH